MYYAWRYLAFQPSRSLLIVASVGLCTVLMTFLISVYRGVADGTLEYVRSNRADLWILQENATNIVRGSSLVLAKQGNVLHRVDGIASLSPLLLTLAVVKRGACEGTVYLAGYDDKAPLGGPPMIVIGRGIQSGDEIVLDDRFAEKYDLAVGDTVSINQENLRVVGFSGGTNAFVIQYAFVSLPTAQRLMGNIRVVSAYLARLDDAGQAGAIRDKIRQVLPNIAVYTHEQFLENNRREMQSGFLPFIVAVCIISAGVLVVILSLLFSILIIERRSDFAVLKTVGAPGLFLPKLVINLTVLIALTGVVLGFGLFVPVSGLVRLVAPELHTITTSWELGLISVCVVAACLLSAIVPLRKLRSIYPGETFA